MLKRFGGMRRKNEGVLPVREPLDEHSEALALLHDYEKSGLGWFWASDNLGNLTYISDCVARTLGCERHELLGQPFSSLLILEDASGGNVARSLPLLLGTRKTFSDFAVKARSPSSEVWWAVSGRPQLDDNGEFLGYRGNGSDVTSTLRDQRDAARLAKFDSLTGLNNRHTMGQRLESTINAYKASQRSCALMMIDLDRFKKINDSMGHQAGDELLRQVSERLSTLVERGCEVGRLGGDEFQMLLPDVDDRGKLGELARQIIALLSQPYRVQDTRCSIGASVGVAIFPFDGQSAEQLVGNADLALYAAKGSGRGQFRFYSSELQMGTGQRRRLEVDLRDALTLGQMRLQYQPMVSLNGNTVVSLEALMRWQHPEYGEIAPSIFLPIAEDTNLIVGLGEWAIREASAAAMGWPGRVSVAVNVAPAQFASQHFVETVEQALEESGLDPERLELELTEGSFAVDATMTDDILADIRKLGVKLTLDNFGAGQSSLGYLRHITFDKIKLDRSVVLDLTASNSRSAAIAGAIVALARQLGPVSCAIGVEALNELQAMRELEITQIQGFVYSPPCSLDEITDVLASGRWVIEPAGPAFAREDRRTVLRRVGVIHEDFRYEVMMRNVSVNGAAIEGLVDVPIGTQFVLDLGEGQLVVCTVRRSEGSVQGLQFESRLVDDGAGGLMTRHRVAPAMLEAMGMPSGPGGPSVVALNSVGGINLPKFGTAADAARHNRAA
ncbi:MAG: EAL domain-containing protein [Novosphingobium sp.]